MRSIIKNILSEEVENLQNVYKGINLSVKMLSQEFPFIVGWEFSEDINKYDFTIYISLLVNLEKVSKFYGLEVDPIYLRMGDWIYSEDSPVKAYPFSGLKYDNLMSDPYIVSKEIWNSLDSTYSYIPEEYKMSNGTITKSLMIDGYRYVK
jgi:hypothetical protein